MKNNETFEGRETEGRETEERETEGRETPNRRKTPNTTLLQVAALLSTLAASPNTANAQAPQVSVNKQALRVALQTAVNQNNGAEIAKILAKMQGYYLGFNFDEKDNILSLWHCETFQKTDSELVIKSRLEREARERMARLLDFISVREWGKQKGRVTSSRGVISGIGSGITRPIVTMQNGLKKGCARASTFLPELPKAK